jgi:hypothetical protein
MESGAIPGFFSMLAWAIFFGATALSVALGLILNYHWVNYARNSSATFVGTIIYSAGCLIILAMLLGAVLNVT